MEIFAHRGASAYYPENTILGFEKAIEMGCTGIETDLQITKDGVLVLIHDEKVDRTTEATGFVKDFTFSEIRKLNAGHYMGLKKCLIPTVEELLEIAKNKNIKINLEIKTTFHDSKNIEEKVIDIIYRYDMLKNVIISSFNLSSLIKCKNIDPQIRLAYLINRFYKIRNLFPTGIDIIHPIYHLVNSKFVSMLKENNFKINVFTVNKKRHMEKLIKLNVDGIITDFPDVASEVINKWM